MGSGACRIGGFVAALLGAGALGACTAKSGGSPSSPSTVVRTQTVVGTRPASHPPSSPVSTGPTTAATAASCPLLATQSAADRVGMRLDRITVLKSSGKVV